MRATASDNAGVLDIELALEDQTLAAAEGSELSLDLVPAEMPGIQPGRTYTLTAIATDAAGNTGIAWLPLPIGAKQVVTATATRQLRPRRAQRPHNAPSRPPPRVPQRSRQPCRRCPAPLRPRRRPRDRFP